MTGTIAQRQNRQHALDLLTAQRALYTEVKRLRRLRTGLLAVSAVASMVLTLVLTAARIPVGLGTGLGVLLLGLVADGRERQRRQSAAAVQEEFDTYVLALPWNTLLADHPPTDLVARCAARHRPEHGDSGFTDWYPPVDETDHGIAVLLCQRVNVSWSAPLHRVWAGVLGTALGSIALAVVLLGLTGVLGVTDLAAAVVAPLLAPVHGLIEALRDNLAHAQQSTRLHDEILLRWRAAIDGVAPASEHDCRQIQDRLLQLRVASPLVSDHLYRLRRAPLEETVRVQASHLEARSGGPP